MGGGAIFTTNKMGIRGGGGGRFNNFYKAVGN